MAEQRRESATAPAGRYDPIRIVPLHQPDLAAPAVPPQLTYRNGPLLSAVEVFTIFWGPAWQQPPQTELANSINQFFTYIVSSSLIDQLGEYSTGSYTIGPGTHVGTATITQPALRHSIGDTAIQHRLQTEIAGKEVAQPTANTLYFVYLPPGVAAIQGGSRSCQAFCGYHNDINGQVFYAVMPFPGCSGCTGGLTQLDALTSTSSHELCEAITDPIPGQGWYDDTHGEIGDICAWKTKKIGNYTVQLEWSNKANACM